MADLRAEIEPPLDLFRQMGDLMDRIGKYGDWEGDETGPTYYLWQQGYAEFAAQCETAIEQSRELTQLWQKLRRANKRRAAKGSR